jgi:hypothetical protein
VWFSGFSLWLVFKLFDSKTGLLVHLAGTLKRSPASVLEIAAMVLLGPFVLAGLIHLRIYGWRGISRFFTFWLIGLRLGIVFLLVAFPYLLVLGAVKYLTVNGLIDADSQFEAFLQLLNMAACVTVLPFWGLMLLRRLPRSLVGGSLIDQLRDANIAPGPQPEDLPPSFSSLGDDRHQPG